MQRIYLSEVWYVPVFLELDFSLAPWLTRRHDKVKNKRRRFLPFRQTPACPNVPFHVGHSIALDPTGPMLR